MHPTPEEKAALQADLDAIIKKHRLDGVVFFGLRDIGESLAVAFVTRLSNSLQVDDPGPMLRAVMLKAADVYDEEHTPRMPMAQA
jgi:hypothetical protein